MVIIVPTLATPHLTTLTTALALSTPAAPGTRPHPGMIATAEAQVLSRAGRVLSRVLPPLAATGVALDMKSRLQSLDVVTVCYTGLVVGFRASFFAPFSVLGKHCRSRAGMLWRAEHESTRLLWSFTGVGMSALV